MSTAQVARLLGCSVQHVRKLVRTGKLPATRVLADTNKYGYRWQIRKEDAMKLLRNPYDIGRPRGAKAKPKPKEET
jgi:excisionase family DNA binding protein